MATIDPYNPLDLEALGDSLLRQLERQPLYPLADIKRFGGSGIYALYFRGTTGPYAAMGEFNQKNACRLPIYVGRAKDTGAREGLNPLDPVTASVLWDRVREHKRSIDNASNLDTADFSVRVLVVMPIWVPLAEAMAIRKYQPVWNGQIPGFGIHAPGSGRSGQERSHWDELHPGRGFAKNLKGNRSAPEDLLALAQDAARRAVDVATRLAVASLEPTVPPAQPDQRERRSQSAASPRPKRR